VIKFNAPYTSGNENRPISECIQTKTFSGNGSFSKKNKDLLNKKYRFENVYLTTSFTSAIQLCAMSINFSEGDQVIMPSSSFPSTPTPFIIKGANIIFADCPEEYPNITLESIKSVKTKKQP
jgi:dTDP-4-amino-4,6-dideoxygalactose transaminase